MIDTLKNIGRVGLLYGGTSSEREISLASGTAVAEALKRLKINVSLIDVGKDLLEKLHTQNPDRAFIALHGPGGEDGTIQGLLEYLEIPYSGSGVKASALAMDKLRCKQMWRGSGLPTADFECLNVDSDWAAILESLGGSVIVKPSREGSSIGMSIAENPQDLEQAWHEAVCFDSEVIAEQMLRGEEYTVAILDGEVLPSLRITTKSNFYDFMAKYQPVNTQYFCPSGLSDRRERELGELCLEAFTSIDCQGWGRVDVMTDENGIFYLLEVNTVPGMTSQSLVPKAAAAAGISFDQLVLKIIEASL